MPRLLEDVLADVPFFAAMPAEEREMIAGCGRNVRFAAGEAIMRQGDPADHYYLLRHGEVAVGNFVPPRGEMVIETLEPGDVLGWSWLFPPYRAHFDARALTLVRATEFDGACLRDKCAADPALGYDVMSRFAQVLIERLQWTRLRLLDLYGNGGHH
ncbi:MAG TPA: cyclic nucleotide-binding domain-containing protein [Gaiellaceae bacterium]|nr:cyclic nucleotide-binding domain-containing protein [Gaiellaceae bacterium]